MSYNIGDKVLLSTRNLSLKGSHPLCNSYCVLGSVHVLVLFYYCSQLVALVCAGCSGYVLQLVTIHHDIELYSGICASICPLVVKYVELLVIRLA